MAVTTDLSLAERGRLVSEAVSTFVGRELAEGALLTRGPVWRRGARHLTKHFLGVSSSRHPLFAERDLGPGQ